MMTAANTDPSVLLLYIAPVVHFGSPAPWTRQTKAGIYEVIFTQRVYRAAK